MRSHESVNDLDSAYRHLVKEILPDDNSQATRFAFYYGALKALGLLQGEFVLGSEFVARCDTDIPSDNPETEWRIKQSAMDALLDQCLWMYMPIIGSKGNNPKNPIIKRPL